jgi:tetratricopeptide (TPR) repeat protein/2-polyprenyl-3-methyl-5-hydroxy-6-metoxy-1,4-benzoquinol methylase
MKRDKAKGAARGGGSPANPAVTQLFTAAVQHHQAGHLQEAQNLYRQALAADPRHAQSLHYLGVLALQAGRPDAAVDLIGQAIALEPRNPESHYNIALAFRALDRMDEVIAHCGRAVALKPDYADAHLNLGNALKQQGKRDEAVTHYRRFAYLRPDSADAHFNLANLFAEEGKLKEASSSYQRTLALKPEHAQALNNLGTLLASQGRGEDAVRYFQLAVQHGSDLLESYINLGRALLAQGRVYEACGVINRAFEIGVAQNRIEQSLDLVRRIIETEESRDTKTLFVQCLRTLPSPPDIPYLRDLLIRGLQEPWGRPSDLVPAATALIAQSAAVAAAIERSERAWPQRLSLQALFGHAGIAPVAGDALLHSLLQGTFLRSGRFERFLTNVRYGLLQLVLEGAENASPDTLRLACSLARQCFINEYVFDGREEEHSQAELLRHSLQNAIHAATDISAFPLAIAAAYFPVHSLHSANTLLTSDWPEPVQALLTQQVVEPQLEQQIRNSIPALTVIEDRVSRAVQEQYEQNPYPRWVKAAPIGRAMTVDEYLGSKFAAAGFRPIDKQEIDVLIAGCGTGQHSTLLAQQFCDAQILAIDLSRASLAYAVRKTQALGLNNLSYAQADILKLGSLGRTFDVVDSSGVLHHLADPLAGWRVLLSLLRPNGVMRLGLYSALGRQDIEAVRHYLREQGYTPAPADIRSARRHLATFPEGTPQKTISEASDFFSLSECRDLLFHVQERSFMLPEIKEFLNSENLTFLGFETSGAVSRLYAQKFPADAPMADLERWHAVETENPRIFFNMYQFWVQKAG